MNAQELIKKPLSLMLMAALAFGSASLLASPDDDERGNRSDDRGGSEDRGGRNDRDDDDTHLGITVDNYDEAVITVFIGTDEDGDGSCLQEGPTSVCVLRGGGSHDLMVNSNGILDALRSACGPRMARQLHGA